MSNTNDDGSKNSKGTNQSKRWTFIQNDLEKALSTWEKLEKNQAPLSQEEEQLIKIKSIINQLKEKLDQF